jgi:hypothetical protein
MVPFGWTGRVGDKGDKYLGVRCPYRRLETGLRFESVPSPEGIELRKSDRSYDGPGIRFVPLLETPPGNPSRSRVTIMPLSGHHVLQLFEDSSDGGKTWHTLFKAEHRQQP